MSAPALIALHLIVLHTVDGRDVIINPAQITSMHAAKDDAQNKVLTDAVRCVVGLADGKFVSVAERCAAVRQLVEGAD